MTRPVYNCTPKLRLMDSTLVDSSRPMSALTRHIQELCKGSFMWGSCILAIWRRALRSRKLRQPSCASRKKASCSRSAYSGMRVHCVRSRSGRSDGTQGRQAAPSPTIPKQSAMFSRFLVEHRSARCYFNSDAKVKERGVARCMDAQTNKVHSPYVYKAPNLDRQFF